MTIKQLRDLREHYRQGKGSLVLLAKN
jgi:hypothetical protein